MADVRPAPFFIGDSIALDFVNSIASPRAVEYEWLATGTDLLDWLVQSGLLREEEISHLRHASHRSGLGLAAEEIREFREEFRTFVSSASETNIVSSDHPMLERLNCLMQRGCQSLRLSPSETGVSGFQLSVEHHLESPDDLLPRIAAACAELIADADFTHVKNCEGEGCTLIFRDVSKNHKRRWCSMEVCGNRAKAAAHRKRSST